MMKKPELKPAWLHFEISVEDALAKWKKMHPRWKPTTKVKLVDYYTAAILDNWEQSVNKLLGCGRMLLCARHGEHALPHGQFTKMVEERLPFGLRTAQILMKVAADQRISDASRDSRLPPHVATLYELTRLDDHTFKNSLTDGRIHPLMERKDARSLVLKNLTQERHKRAAKQNVGTGVSLWLADPPWDPTFRLPYDTMSIQAIKNLRMRPDGNASVDPKYPSVADASAPCAAIGLWAIDEMLHEAEEVLAAWGFEMLNPRIIWDKGSHARSGRAALMQHEYLLIGVRGGAMPVWLDKSVKMFPRAGLKNSQKPVEFHAMLQKMFPLLNERMELFARRTPPDGWRGWGNQNPGPARKLLAA